MSYKYGNVPFEQVAIGRTFRLGGKRYTKKTSTEALEWATNKLVPVCPVRSCAGMSLWYSYR